MKETFYTMYCMILWKLGVVPKKLWEETERENILLQQELEKAKEKKC